MPLLLVQCLLCMPATASIAPAPLLPCTASVPAAPRGSSVHLEQLLPVCRHHRPIGLWRLERCLTAGPLARSTHQHRLLLGAAAAEWQQQGLGRCAAAAGTGGCQQRSAAAAPLAIFRRQPRAEPQQRQRQPGQHCRHRRRQPCCAGPVCPVSGGGRQPAHCCAGRLLHGGRPAAAAGQLLPCGGALVPGWLQRPGRR